ncbi:DoxX family protein [Rufibacter tibetensis]|uniref:DoxX family protein n=1 Tax=Rufibacter tibetensis TaxID=512763 RepID=A0A0P0CL20_9BACT|nr:DoxX family protein [Rufibacter tibetensis]ALJ00277.1 DoxX family protein [Rufibacter tibetensis]
MNWVQQVDQWQNQHRPVAYDYGRIILGLFILYKGLTFIADTSALAEIIQNSQFKFLALGLAHYVAFAHLVGGVLIAIGLITRVAVGFQIPILIGAVFFFNPGQGFFSVNPQFAISLITLIALIFYFVGGSGYYSVDHRFESNEKKLQQKKTGLSA